MWNAVSAFACTAWYPFQVIICKTRLSCISCSYLGSVSICKKAKQRNSSLWVWGGFMPSNSNSSARWTKCAYQITHEPANVKMTDPGGTNNSVKRSKLSLNFLFGRKDVGAGTTPSCRHRAVQIKPVNKECHKPSQESSVNFWAMQFSMQEKSGSSGVRSLGAGNTFLSARVICYGIREMLIKKSYPLLLLWAQPVFHSSYSA